MLLRKTQVAPLQFHSSLGFDSWDASGVLTLSFIFGSLFWSLMASLTGKTVDLNHVTLIPGLVDA